jgi:hypothetical protein
MRQRCYSIARSSSTAVCTGYRGTKRATRVVPNGVSAPVPPKDTVRRPLTTSLPRRAARGRPASVHGALFGVDGASLLHRPWPCRSPCRHVYSVTGDTARGPISYYVSATQCAISPYQPPISSNGDPLGRVWLNAASGAVRTMRRRQRPPHLIPPQRRSALPRELGSGSAATPGRKM